MIRGWTTSMYIPLHKKGVKDECGEQSYFGETQQPTQFLRLHAEFVPERGRINL